MSLCRLILSHPELIFVTRSRAVSHSRAPHTRFPCMHKPFVAAIVLLAVSSCYLIGLKSRVSEASGFSAGSSSSDTSAAGVSVEVREKQQVTLEPGPLVTFAAIEQAWNMGWVDSLVTFFPGEKITLRLDKNVPESAFFTQKQASYMLKDSFRYRVTESFEFLEFKYKKGGNHPALGKAQWSFRREPTGKTTVAKVQVTLRKEGEHWLISGIRIQD